jgi:hypothetical protein
MRRQSARRLSACMAFSIATCALALVTTRGEAGDPQPDLLLGAWKLKCTSPDGKARECILVLSREGTLLKGDYVVGKTTRPARYVEFDRGELRFLVDGKYAGQVYTLIYKGRPRGNALQGAVHWKYGWASGSIDFTGERITQSVAEIP